MRTSIKDFVIAVSSGVVSGLILNYIGTLVIPNTKIIWFIVALAILISLCVYLVLFVCRCRSLGIVKILNSSIKGEGSTESYMKRANHSICFVGIAASKWVKNADLLEQTIRSICSLNSGHIRFLLLNPDSDAAKKLTLAQQSPNEKSVKHKIEDSLDKLTNIAERIADQDENLLKKFEIRLYDQMPIYRLTIIDNLRSYFCFYQIGCDGSNLKQFVIRQKNSATQTKQQNIFNCMSEYFQCLWDSPNTISYAIVKPKVTLGENSNANTNN